MNTSKRKEEKSEESRTPSRDEPTPKQKEFVNALLRQHPPMSNASKAYREAYNAEGMCDEAIAVEACRLKQHPKVTLMLDRESERVDAIVRRSTAQQRLWIVQELTRLATDALSDSAKVRSLELLGKVRGVDLFDSTNTEESQRKKMNEHELVSALQSKLAELFPSGVTHERVIDVSPSTVDE